MKKSLYGLEDFFFRIKFYKTREYEIKFCNKSDKFYLIQ